MDWKSLIPSLVEMTNSQYIAARENKRDHDLFNEGYKRDLDLFKESLKFNKESFLIDSKKELKQHEQQLIADYIHNLKESAISNYYSISICYVCCLEYCYNTRYYT